MRPSSVRHLVHGDEVVPADVDEAQQRQRRRVVEGVERLVRGGYVAQWTDHASVMAGRADHDRSLWEANRAARWVIENGLLAKNQKTSQRLHKGNQP